MRKPWLRLKDADLEIFELIEKELNRQRDGIELIASENFASAAVVEAAANVYTNKYAEGLPGKRYYGGCEHVDTMEQVTIERAKKLFHCQFANVQPHSGAQANAAVFMALAQPGDRVLGLDLSNGGHLTHGSKVNFSGRMFESHFYKVDTETECLDMEEVRRVALDVKPKILIAGASAYPRAIDFAEFRKIADEVGAYLLVDMAHIAGLVAAELHSSPIGHAHVVTTTTHKTLRGPRGGLILWNDESLTKEINKCVFPGTQGGPLEHIIAAKAVAFGEALKPEFKSYQMEVVRNANTLAEALQKDGFRLVSGGTDNHLVLMDFSDMGVTGKQMEETLGKADITVNKNTVPREKLSPFVTSGLRLGTPAVTSRGLKGAEMVEISRLIKASFDHRDDDSKLQDICGEVHTLMRRFPLYPEWVD